MAYADEMNYSCLIVAVILSTFSALSQRRRLLFGFNNVALWSYRKVFHYKEEIYQEMFN